MSAMRLSLLLVPALLAGCASAGTDTTAVTSSVAKTYYAKAIKDGSRDADRLSYLENLPPRKKPIRIAVYEIPDHTGKHRPNDSYADYSRAVTQGAEALVIQALADAGKGRYFDVVERRFVERVLNERTLVERSHLDAQQRRFHMEQEAQQDAFVRAIRLKQYEVDQLETEYRRNELARAAAVSTAKAKIAEMNRAIETAQKGGDAQKAQQLTSEQRFFGADADASIAKYDDMLAKTKDRFETAQRELARLKENMPREETFTAADAPAALPYVSTANYIITGSIVDYSSNYEAGGAGLGLLNVRAQDEIRRDMVTLSLRLVDTRTSRIVSTSTVSKSIFSRRTQAGGAGYVTVSAILEGEAGIAVNEPGVFAMSRAINLALANIVEDARTKGIW